ncbi:MAG: MFS transporter [Acetanaerobacterium sp.]
MTKRDFPIKLFVLYVIFYSGQAVFTTYLNLYLNDIGFCKAQMGSITSISTLLILITQPLWGIASDRTKNKNVILSVLFMGCAVLSLAFYINTSYIYVLVVISLFWVFYSPCIPLQDNMTLETLEKRASRFDFGHIRIGGTIGYAVTALVVGYLIHDSYKQIFYIVCIAMICCFFFIRSIEPVEGNRRGKKHSYKEILKNKAILCLVFFNLMFSLGSSIFNSYYPLYFASIGGNSTFIGLLMFVCAISEIPLWIFVGRIVNKIGYARLMVIAGVITSLRWLLLYIVTDPILIILVNLTHGMGFVSFNYCILVYINNNVPKDLRATGQTVNALTIIIFTKVIGGYLIGYASDVFGVQNMMLLAGITTISATVIFIAWYRGIRRKTVAAATQ